MRHARHNQRNTPLRLNAASRFSRLPSPQSPKSAVQLFTGCASSSGTGRKRSRGTVQEKEPPPEKTLACDNCNRFSLAEMTSAAITAVGSFQDRVTLDRTRMDKTNVAHATTSTLPAFESERAT